jgi:chorismate lyase
VSPRYLVRGPLRHWVDLSGSMTREIARVSGSPPDVKVNFEGPGRLAPWEAGILRLALRRRIWIREVALEINGEAVLLARTVTPISSPVMPMLQGLGGKPLAELLFTDPRWQRPGTPMPVRLGGTGPLPGRAALWQYAGDHRSCLLVEEFFLPVLIGPDQAVEQQAERNR